MPPPVNRNLAAFQQIAKKATSSRRSSIDDSYTTSGSQHIGKHNLTIHKSHGRGHQRNTSPTNVHSGEGSSIGSQFGSQDDFSSGDASDAELHQRDAKGNRKGLVYQKTENIITKIRDLIAQSDVFISRRESPPFVAALKISIWFIPILLVALIWDTLAVTAFQVPHLSWIDHPAFILGWHFIMLVLAMYGFMLSFLSSGNSPRTSMAAISLGIHYILLIYRIFMEVYFDGFRGQEKLWIESRI
ncbi:hypothetical protein Ocin01_03379 [Orchesella cincta]|uniref:Uncharacterized protein n=1 Tax=Orchesella cincta TaxID=48709 RepID=A0A1D2NDF8_ORCCI|nr:hypothetical protein Ocin01_03379 [Orchesella cincta]